MNMAMKYYLVLSKEDRSNGDIPGVAPGQIKTPIEIGETLFLSLYRGAIGNFVQQNEVSSITVEVGNNPFFEKLLAILAEEAGKTRDFRSIVEESSKAQLEYLKNKEEVLDDTIQAAIYLYDGTEFDHYLPPEPPDIPSGVTVEELDGTVRPVLKRVSSEAGLVVGLKSDMSGVGISDKGL